ncbi:MAG: hypothetical protein DRP16_01350 [Candidatus Aenigmatarchaeota archaeon]|nr:MAG: hypothetical protein DRP16_01350 [Candidatus Aenigmarchaeota archaeon]
MCLQEYASTWYIPQAYTSARYHLIKLYQVYDRVKGFPSCRQTARCERVCRIAYKKGTYLDQTIENPRREWWRIRAGVFGGEEGRIDVRFFNE